MQVGCARWCDGVMVRVCVCVCVCVYLIALRRVTAVLQEP
jgi:hypothetical protein